MPAEQLTGAIVTNYTIPAAVQITQSITATPMPTPVLANVTPVVTGAVINQPSTTALNPFLDIAPLHGVQFLWLNTIPLWAFIGAALFFYWFWFNVSQWRKNSVLSPCYGYKDALMAGSIEAQQVIVFTKSRKWFIRMLTYHSEGMLYFKDLLRTDMWHMGGSSAVGTLGGLSAAITKDSFDEVVDPVADIALCTACYKFNSGEFGDDKNRERAKQEMELINVQRPDGSECSIPEAMSEGLIPVSIGCFDDYIRLRPIMESIWPDGSNIPCYSQYDPYEADKYIPKQRSASLNGGVILKDANDYAEDNISQPSWWDSNGIAMILILGGLIIMGISYLATR
jgi:hypothetical protein